ncbi:DinB/UmuC family translesion DNA polymerase [Streptomyces xanthophaeus]
MATLVRLVGAAAGRALHEHARGQAPPRTVQTGPTAKSLAADRAFEHDVLDPGEHGRAVLDRAEEALARPRNGQQAADGLSLSVRHADRTSNARSRILPQPRPGPGSSPPPRTSSTTWSASSGPGSAASACVRRTSAPRPELPNSSPSSPTTTTRVPSKRSPTAPGPVTAPAHSGPPPSHPAAFAERDCNLSSCQYRAVPGTATARGPWTCPAISAVTTSRAGHGLSVPAFRAPQRRYRGCTRQRHPRSPG